LPFVIVAGAAVVALMSIVRFQGKNVEHPPTIAAVLTPGSVSWTSAPVPRGNTFRGITPAGLNVEIISFDAADQTVSARLSLAFTNAVVTHLRLMSARHRTLVLLMKVPPVVWAQLPVAIKLAPCVGAFFTPETCGKPIATIPLGQLLTSSGGGAARHGSSVRAVVTLPVYGWPSRFPLDTYRFITSPQITLPNRVVLATLAAGGVRNRSTVPTRVVFFGDSGLGGHTLTAYQFPPPKRRAISLIIGRPLTYQITVIVVALLPLFLGVSVVHASARQRGNDEIVEGGMTRMSSPAFDTTVAAGLIAAMLAILPLRAVLVPADLNVGGLTLLDYILVLDVLFIAAFVFFQYAKFVTKKERSDQTDASGSSAEAVETEPT